MSDLVVLSHLRWAWVWQRPQHLISRMATGRRTWFIEEPWPADVDEPRLGISEEGPVTRVWLDVPGRGEEYVMFDDARAEGYADIIRELLGPAEQRVAWLYTPLALHLADAIDPTIVVYDVMDDLASFKDASPHLRLRQRELLGRADVVFTGGRSLHRGVVEKRPEGTHLFASGVEPEHYQRPRPARPPGHRPVAGYVGVIDERLDLELLAALADALPDWEIRMVGPVTKISVDDLPQRGNITYPGRAAYEELPDVMSGFDVALMPFALNEATRSISPTKTLEYLAAGLPVVSTRIADVVADYTDVVVLADTAVEFADQCRRLLPIGDTATSPAVRQVLRWQHWDRIVERMGEHVDAALHAASVTAEEEQTA